MSASTVKIVYSFRSTPDLNNELIGALNAASPGVIDLIHLGGAATILQEINANGLIIIPPVANAVSLYIGSVIASPPIAPVGGIRISPNYPTFLALVPDPLGVTGITISKDPNTVLPVLDIKLVWL